MPFILGASSASDTVHNISQSIRFNTSDNPFMGRTPSATGTEETWTWSFWIKRASLGTLQILFQIGSNKSNCDQFYFNSDDELVYQHLDSGSNTDSIITKQLFRDTSAWYHIVLTADTTNAVESERIRIYVNGVRVTDFDGTPNYPTQNTPTDVNTQVLHQIGAQLSATYYSFDGYMAEIVLLDGTATDCNSFAEFNSSGIWIPKSVSSLTFGTNGFHIDGRDATGSPVKLGDDEAGSNNYTTSGMETNDQRADTPTNNQITFNPLNNQRSGGTPSNGNLDYVGPGTRTIISLTANIPSTGKWTVAYKVAQVSTSQGWQIGIAPANQSDFGDAAGSNEDLQLIRIQPSSSNLEIGDYVNSTSINPSQPITTSDEFWVAVDMDSGNVYLGIYDASATAMVWIANDAGLDGNPATGANPTVTYNTTQMPRDNVVFAVGSKQTSQHIYLQRSTEISGTTPTGFTYFENVKDLI